MSRGAAMNDPVKQQSEPAIDTEAVRDQVTIALRGIYDPEIPVNIYDLGLIYRVDVSADGRVAIDMTLTTPNCPAAQSLPANVEHRVSMVRGVQAVDLRIVWDPPWTPDSMSEDARLILGLD